MTLLFRFVDVQSKSLEHTYSFALHSGEIRLLQLASSAEKNAIIDIAVGRVPCKKGVVEIVQSGTRCWHDTDSDRLGASSYDASIICRPLNLSRPGRVGWVAGNGGLINNLKIWENVTLPHWYHTRRDPVETEKNIRHWLSRLGLAQEEFASFMSALPYSIDPWQCKLAGLLRALVQMPRVLVVDAEVFETINVHLVRHWIMALEDYVAQGHAILVVADKMTDLSWKKIE